MSRHSHNTQPGRHHPLLFAAAFTGVFMLAGAPHSYADQLDIPDSPLFLGRPITPNLLLVMDDSGSMDWEILRSPGSFQIAAYDGFPNAGNLDITPTPDDPDEMLESCVGYNSLYYDPDKTYTPWVGVDEDGQPFTDQDITSARDNPYDPDPDQTTDLTQEDCCDGLPGYFEWKDADSDGEFDRGECPDPALSSYDYDAQFIGTAGTNGTRVMTDAEKQNFANWYTYYRKREYVMKRAVTPLVRDFNMRMGLGTLHNNNNVGTAIRELQGDPGARANLLRQTARIDSSGNTPLRNRLEDAGQYYDQHDNPTWHQTLGFTDTDPILPAEDGGMCQQNFTLLLSDGFWNGGEAGVDNADGDNNTEYDGASYGDQHEETLADVAMHYYERDLDRDLDNVVPVDESRNDVNPAQHMVTYTVSFGLTGTLEQGPDDFDDPFAWPRPEADQPTTADDMLHAAWNGRGEFLSADDPQQLIDALSGALSDIEARGGTAASAAANAGSITTESRVYQARFDSRDWHGELLSFEIENDGDIANLPEWNANEKLNSAANLATTRNVVTFDPSNFTGTKFSWGSLSDAQKDLLDDNPINGDTDDPDFGEALVNFIRGSQDADEELSVDFRERENLLGDLVNSDPIFVGAPAFFFNFDNYIDFFFAHENRTKAVYVGGNDGMLHAFNADFSGNGGDELFSYVPGAVLENLNELADPNYQHHFYVDGQQTYGDAQIDGNWRSVLAGGLGAGGQAVYALDITDPAAFDETDVLWEFTDADDPDLGLTFARPQIRRMANDEWAVIMGNGYNNSRPDGNASDNGEAALFILFIERGRDGWQTGDYVKLRTGAGSKDNPNGLATVAAADIDADNKVDTIYGGDLQGNMWKFDVSDTSPSAWNVDFGGQALFTAVSPGGETQPITTRPGITLHPAGPRQGVVVVFGTGKFLELGDRQVTNQPSQTIYGIWDRAAAPNSSFTDHDFSRSELAQINLTTNSGFRVVDDDTSEEVDYFDDDGNPNQRGWFTDLPEAGERIVDAGLLRSGIVFLVSLIPDESPCSGGGRGWLMALEGGTGQAPDNPVFDINGDNDFGEADLLGPDDDVVPVGLAQTGIPNRPAVIYDPRPFCQVNPEACDEDGDGEPDVTVPAEPFPPPLNARRPCGQGNNRTYLYTTQSNGALLPTTATMNSIQCGRQAWQQRR